eukprot:513345-Pleurochrysis_carterae.AAC.1
MPSLGWSPSPPARVRQWRGWLGGRWRCLRLLGVCGDRARMRRARCRLRRAVGGRGGGARRWLG